jgi:ribosomal protein S18 acetylase RimI-like enzyme
MSGVTYPAAREDLSWVWPAAAAAHLFSDGGELTAEWESAPWRVRVTAKGEAAVLGPWRAHLPIMAVRGLWCSGARVPMLLEDLRVVARQQGFERILSPLVPKEHAGPYERAGLERVQEVVVFRRERLGVSGSAAAAGPAADAGLAAAAASSASPAPPTGIRLTVGTPADLRAVRDVDAAAFDDFWRYDELMLARYMASDRVGLAYRNAQVVGYTLSTLHGSECTLGRLAVVPGEQGRGIGAALVSEAMAAAARDGARSVTLCTQAENSASRRLYERAGFKESPGHLVGLLSAPL